MVLWNTKTNSFTQGPSYPSPHSDPRYGGHWRWYAESMVWNNSTIIFGGGAHAIHDAKIYKYTIDGGFQSFSTFDKPGRYVFNMINVPTNEFVCN